MRFALTARQISLFKPLPVITRYQIPRDRLHADSAFADNIIAKYTAKEEQDLPSVDFAYPQLASSAAETMDRLSSQLITLNRIRVQMNVYNQHWLHQLALSLSTSCQVLLQQLKVSSNTSPGSVSQASVNELEQVFRELRYAAEVKNAETSLSGTDIQSISEEQRETILRELKQLKTGAMRGALQQTQLRDASPLHAADSDDTSVTKQARLEQEQGETVLRILTAASRGNGTRERYMSELYRRLQESGRGGQESRSVLLNRAGTELLLLKTPGTAFTPLISGWASESARQFFWRVQRAPEQERRLLLQAGGFGTVVSLERALKSMDSNEFRRFSLELTERMHQLSELSAMSEPIWGDSHSAGIEQQIAQITPEEWAALTGLLEKEGYLFTDKEIVSLDEEEIPMLASEQARQLFWRIQRAPEQERQFFLKAGGFSSMEALEKALNTMDEVSFRRFSSQIVERLHRFAAASGQQDVKAERFFGSSYDSGSGSTRALNASAVQDSDSGSGDSSGDRLMTQKQIVLRQLHTGGTTAAALEKALRTVLEQRQVLTENTQIFNMLSESVLNMTLEDWKNFRTDITNINENELPGGVSLSFLQGKGAEGMTASGQTNESPVYINSSSAAASGNETGMTADTAQAVMKEAERVLREEGIRMSREKTELIRELRVLSRMPDSSIRTLEHLLREHTVFSKTSPSESGQSYYQKLSARERESWKSFITNLMSEQNGSQSADTSIPTEQVFLRIHTGLAGTLQNQLGENRIGSEAALNVVEKLREERVITDSLRLREQYAAAGGTDTFAYLLKGKITPAAGNASAGRLISMNGEPDMELAAADMETPHRAETARQELEAARRQQAEKRQETSYRDIEFETVSYHKEEHSARETAAGLSEVMNRLDQQQRDIERLQNTQQRLAERNVSRDILKKLDDRVQMERLRGGR